MIPIDTSNHIPTKYSCLDTCLNMFMNDFKKINVSIKQLKEKIPWFLLCTVR
jgi:hypothetical protein